MNIFGMTTTKPKFINNSVSNMSEHDYLTAKRPRKEVFCGRIINVGIEQVKNAAGEVSEFEIIRHPGGAVIVALNNENKICLLRQFRHAIDQWIWELPAGKLELDEPSDISASRELEEEAGVIAKNWQSLGKIYSSPGVFDEALYLFFASGLKVTKTNFESHEFIEIHWIDLKQAYQWSLNNTICDAKSIIAITRAYSLVNSR